MLFTPYPLEDEAVYFRAFEAVAEGRSPYGSGYLYPPIFAYAGAFGVSLFGEAGSLAFMRLANAGGLAVLIGLAGLPIKDPRSRLGAAALIAVASPGVDIALRWGNLTPFISALLVAAVLLLERRDLSAFRRGAGSALTFGVGVLIKPLGAIVPLLLLWPPPRKNGSRRRTAQVAATVALGLTALGLLAPPGLRDFLTLGSSPERSAAAGRSVSLQRLLYSFGIELPPLVVVALVAAIAGLGGRMLANSRGLDRFELLSWLTVSALLATPIVWNHTTLMALPVQAGAMAAWTARRARAPWWEGVLVLLAILSQHLAAGVGGVEDQAPTVQGLAILIPSLAPIFLLWYQLAMSRRHLATGAGGRIDGPGTVE